MKIIGNNRSFQLQTIHQQWFSLQLFFYKKNHNFETRDILLSLAQHSLLSCNVHATVRYLSKCYLSRRVKQSNPRYNAFVCWNKKNEYHPLKVFMKKLFDKKLILSDLMYFIIIDNKTFQKMRASNLARFLFNKHTKKCDSFYGFVHLID